MVSQAACGDSGAPTQCTPGFTPPPELAYMKHGKQFHHGGLVIQLHSTHASARALGCRTGPTNVFFLQRAFVKNEEEEFLQKHLAVAKELSMRWGEPASREEEGCRLSRALPGAGYTASPGAGAQLRTHAWLG